MPQGAPRQEPVSSYLAGWVDLIASEYGWTTREVLSLPIAVLHQYHRRIAARTRRGTPFVGSKSARLVGAYLRKISAGLKNEQQPSPPAAEPASA